MRVFLKKSIILMLAVLLSMGLWACGEKEKLTNTEIEANSWAVGEEYAYVPEFLSIAREEFGHSGFFDPVIWDGKLYYRYFNLDQESWLSQGYLEGRDLQKPDTVITPAFTFEMEGYHTGMESFCVDEDGNFYIAWSVWPEYVEGEEYNETRLSNHLVKYNSAGEPVKSVCISEKIEQSDISFVEALVVDKEGNIYINTGGQILIYDKKLSFENSFYTGNVQNLFLMDGERVFATRLGGVDELIELDVKKGNIKAAYNNIPSYNGFFADGGNGKLLYVSEDKLYEYDLETQESVEVLTWVEAYITGNCINSLQVLEDGRLAVVCRDLSDDDAEVALLSKVPRLEQQEKEVLTLATFTGDDYELQQKVVEFNRTSDTYEVQIKSYFTYNSNVTDTGYNDAMTLLHMDIVSGEAPDIINLRELDLYNLADSKALEDLTPYLEASTLSNIADFEQGVLDAFCIDGAQVTVPVSFWMNTIFAKSSLVGVEPGWTLEELVTLREAYPEADFMEIMDKNRALEFCLQFGSDTFIDYETGTCGFDSELFLQVLKFADSFGRYGGFSDTLYADLQENEIVLLNEVLTTVEDYQLYSAIIEEPCTVIGFPTGDGSPATAMTGWEMYAICARSDSKDGAWAFIESVLAQKELDGISGFPTRSSLLEEFFAEAMAPEYKTNYIGGLVYDEAGNPIEVPKVGYTHRDYEAEIYEATEADIAAIRELITYTRADGVRNQKVLDIVKEEAAAYFAGQKSAQEVADIIQNRVEIYVSETS